MRKGGREGGREGGESGRGITCILFQMLLHTRGDQQLSDCHGNEPPPFSIVYMVK